MSPWFLLIFLNPCCCENYADPQTREQKEVARECAGVSVELQTTLRFITLTEIKEKSHGYLVTKARQWVKENQHGSTISDECVAAIVREIATKYGRTDEQVKAEAHRRREAESTAASENQQVWERLNQFEKQWVLTLQTSGKPPTLTPLTIKTMAVGVAGPFAEDVSLQLVSIVSESAAIVTLKSQGDSLDVWIGEWDTSGLASERKYSAPLGVFWIPRNISYQTAIGRERWIYYCEPVKDFDPEKLQRIVPPADELAEFEKRQAYAPRLP